MNGFEFMAIAAMWMCGSSTGNTGLFLALLGTLIFVIMSSVKVEYREEDNEDDDEFCHCDECEAYDDVLFEASVKYEFPQPTVGVEFPENAVKGHVHFIEQPYGIQPYQFDGYTWAILKPFVDSPYVSNTVETKVAPQ